MNNCGGRCACGGGGGGAGSLGGTRVLVLGGGPDAEREVSLNSSRCVSEALGRAGLAVEYRVIDRLTLAGLRALAGDVVLPILHGAFGEGGELQDLLEEDGRPYLGCGPRAARLAMDKIATKLAAARAGVATAECAVLNVGDGACPLALPVVVKPVHEGSSVGLHVCRDVSAWGRAVESVRRERAGGVVKAYMVERFVSGRELTVGVLDGRALPVIHIAPAEGLYDYQAKYHRNDTRYTVNPELPPGVAQAVQERALRVSRELGVRHLCRVDFLLDASGEAWLLEVNTMPGFTDHSLLPMAASATGLDMPRLCVRLVEMAVRDGARVGAA